MAGIGGPNTVDTELLLCLDAANKRSYPGSGTTWNDLSGFANHGTLTNGPTFSGENVGSIVFDGVDDYTNVNSVLTSRPFTFSCWVYFNSLTGWQTMVGQDTSQSTLFGAYYFQKVQPEGTVGRTGNTVGLSLVNTSNQEIYCYDPQVVSTALWYNYVVSVSTSDIILYKNGLQVNIINDSSTLATPTGNMLVGGGYYNNTIGDFMNGRIANVNIYIRTLSAIEVLQNFNATRRRFGV